MEYSRLFLKKFKIMRFQVWNLAKFQTWNRIFLNFFKKNLECSKINEIYFLWTLSGPILSKIWDTFFSKKKVSVVGGIWKKKSKNFPIFKLEIGFFSDFAEKSQIDQNSQNLFTLNFIWANFEPNQRNFLAVGRSVAHY